MSRTKECVKHLAQAAEMCNMSDDQKHKIERVRRLYDKYPEFENLSPGVLESIAKDKNIDIEEEVVKQSIALLKSRYNPATGEYFTGKGKTKKNNVITGNEIKAIINNIRGFKQEQILNKITIRGELLNRTETIPDETGLYTIILTIRNKNKEKSSFYRGAYWDDRRNKKWHAQIRINGITKDIGYFYSEIEAAKAYDKVAKERFGKFAKLNFPEDV